MYAYLEEAWWNLLKEQGIFRWELLDVCKLEFTPAQLTTANEYLAGFPQEMRETLTVGDIEEYEPILKKTPNWQLVHQILDSMFMLCY